MCRTSKLVLRLTVRGSGHVRSSQKTAARAHWAAVDSAAPRGGSGGRCSEELQQQQERQGRHHLAQHALVDNSVPEQGLQVQFQAQQAAQDGAPKRIVRTIPTGPRTKRERRSMPPKVGLVSIPVPAVLNSVTLFQAVG